MYKIFLTVAVVMVLIGHLMSNSFEFGICHANELENIYDVSCHAFYENVGNPIYYAGGALAIVFLALALYPKAAFIWKRFAVWYLPLGTALFLFSRDPGSGDFLSPYPEQIYQWVGGLFVVISLAIIAIGAALNKAGKKIPQDGKLLPNLFLLILWLAYIVWLLWSIASWLWNS